jgi:hypothetical protein
MTALIGKKRQRGGSGVADTQMATGEEGDEEANSSSGDRHRQGGDRQNRVGGDRQDGDRQDGESEENSRATIGGSGYHYRRREESRISDVETGWFRANGSSIVAFAGEALNL